jgi:hypothetical protein
MLPVNLRYHMRKKLSKNHQQLEHTPHPKRLPALSLAEKSLKNTDFKKCQITGLPGAPTSLGMVLDSRMNAIKHRQSQPVLRRFKSIRIT